ncbi:MAG: AAA family ATPase, partial [Anaerolineaceae bacterium]|nr:AAA family ATPase [Anaerolineaceae bacterium]
MKISCIQIKNFRSLKDVSFSLQELTVFIGENDAGKSSVLD